MLLRQSMSLSNMLDWFILYKSPENCRLVNKSWGDRHFIGRLCLFFRQASGGQSEVMLATLKKKRERLKWCANFVQVSIVTECNISPMWPIVSPFLWVWSQFETTLKTGSEAQVYRLNTRGSTYPFPAVPLAVQPAITWERSNLFQSIVPSYKSWSPKCVCMSVCEHILKHKLSFLINLPTHAHCVNMLFFLKKKKKEKEKATLHLYELKLYPLKK